jgi:hypothetical protein
MQFNALHMEQSDVAWTCAWTHPDTFLEAVEAYVRRSPGDQPLTVTREIRYEPHQISLAQACRLVWNCTDVLPGHAFNALTRDCELAIQRQTYGRRAGNVGSSGGGGRGMSDFTVTDAVIRHIARIATPHFKAINEDITEAYPKQRNCSTRL